jgi:hypothetical protein
MISGRRSAKTCTAQSFAYSLFLRNTLTNNQIFNLLAKGRDENTFVLYFSAFLMKTFYLFAYKGKLIRIQD